MLSMDLPNAPLFQDVMEKNIIPQVSLERALLKKFDGVTADPKTRRRFKITKLPNYLIVNYSRFTKNNFFVEKNPTIVTFPTRGLNLADHIPVPRGDENSATYDLIANIVHDGAPDDGSYRAMVYHAPDKNWYETQDLRVAEVLPQQVNLTETYVQIYERRDKRRDA
jgi:U4/U6.U5 tri-snRNP-associated protein 2